MMMKKAGYSIAVLAFLMVMTAGVGKAWAYFTTYASAEGGITITLGDETEIEEEFRSDGTVEFRFVMAGCWYVLELCGKRLSVRSEVRE